MTGNHTGLYYLIVLLHVACCPVRHAGSKGGGSGADRGADGPGTGPDVPAGPGRWHRQAAAPTGRCAPLYAAISASWGPESYVVYKEPLVLLAVTAPTGVSGNIIIAVTYLYALLCE